jgi:hypothetical protein
VHAKYDTNHRDERDECRGLPVAGIPQSVSSLRRLFESLCFETPQQGPGAQDHLLYCEGFGLRLIVARFRGSRRGLRLSMTTRVG